MASSERPTAPGAMARYNASSSSIVKAMTGFPQYVAGNWSLTTPLMAAFGGELLAKEGAEGFYAMALAPALCTELNDRLGLTDDRSVGIALKLNDGSMARGRNQVILKTLELLGIDLAARPALQPFRRSPMHNVAGTWVGEIRAEFDLEIL
jgi:L-asparaginase II